MNNTITVTRSIDGEPMDIDKKHIKTISEVKGGKQGKCALITTVDSEIIRIKEPYSLLLASGLGEVKETCFSQTFVRVDSNE